MAAVVLYTSVPVGAAIQLNLDQTFADVRGLIAGGGQADILILGDSLSVRGGTYLPVLRERLQAEFGDAGYGYQAFSKWTGAGFNQGSDPTNPAWTFGLVNHDTDPHLSLDGMWSTSASPTPVGPTSAWFDALSDAIELHYLAQPGGGGIKITLPDGTQTVINTSSATREVRTWSYQFADAQRRLVFQPDGAGPVTILGQNNINNVPGVRLHRAANGGWGVDNFLARDETFDDQLGLINPDVVAIWLGQNDHDQSPESYSLMVNQLVDRVQNRLPDSEVLLIGTYDSGSPILAGLVNAVEQVAASRSLGFINVYELGGSYSTTIYSGLIDDGVHFSPAGGAYFADILFDQIFPLMMPAWSDLDADGFIGISDLNIILNNWSHTVTPGDRGAGDLDQDGFVGLTDLSLVLSRWNESAPGVPMLTGDINRDGRVGQEDLDIMQSEWGKTILPGPPLTGDVNLDGFVGLNDLNMLLSHWNQNVGPDSRTLGDLNGDGFIGLEDLSGLLGDWNKANVGAIRLESDLTGDGVVDEADLELMMKYWQQWVAADAAAIPEPGVLWLCTPAGLILAKRGRNHRLPTPTN